MVQKHRILIVEDDDTLCDTLEFNLELEGYEALKAYSAEEALGIIKNPAHPLPDLILLDVMMGDMDGFRCARQLKESPDTANIPIIFCTARDTEDDMLTGLAIGADDYIFKPYTIRNVVARVKAVLRRTGSNGGGSPDTRRVEYGDIVLDLDTKRCIVCGEDVYLVKKEFEILHYLIAHRGRIVSREEILRDVWRGEAVVNDRTVDVNITRIRQKLSAAGDIIITRSGYGYGAL